MSFQDAKDTAVLLAITIAGLALIVVDLTIGFEAIIHFALVGSAY